MEEENLRYDREGRLRTVYSLRLIEGANIVKCRDAFDIKVLKDSGAELYGNLKFHLEDEKTELSRTGLKIKTSSMNELPQ